MSRMQIKAVPILCFITCLLVMTGCGFNMQNQARVEPFEASQAFAENRSARSLPAHTVQYKHTPAQNEFYTGRTVSGDLVTTLPLSVTNEAVEQGQVQYDTFCAPCHGPSGAGDGVIVQRGFTAPPSFHSDRLRQASPGHFFDVITHGAGKMYSYADRVSPEDRWAIIAYIQTLQAR